jgi:uncharacterized delta-60 repeat protein
MDRTTGVLDTDFSGNGIRKFSYSTDNSFALSMSLDGSKTTWLSGYRQVGAESKMTMSAIDNEGQLFEGDNDFTNGKETKANASVNSDDSGASVIKIQNGTHAGKFLAASVANDTSNDNLVLSRFTTAGLLDTTFDTDGHKQVQLGRSTKVTGMLELSSGKFIVYGNATVVDSDDNLETHGFVAQLDAEANLDTSFATNGSYTSKAITATSINFNQVAVDSTGKIVAVGVLDGGAFILRLTSAGALDATFNTVGHASASVLNFYNTLVIDGSNNIFVAGYRSVSNKDMHVAKYATTGLLDSGFGSSGAKEIILEASFDDYVEQILLDANGNLYLVGNNLNTPNKVSVVKMSATGTLDTDFSGDGITNLVMSPSNANAKVLDAKLDSAGNLVIAGYGEIGGVSKSMLGRITSAGALDALFNTTGHYQTATCSNGAQFNSMILLSDTSLVLAGQCFIDATFKNNIEFSQYQLLEP